MKAGQQLRPQVYVVAAHQPYDKVVLLGLGQRLNPAGQRRHRWRLLFQWCARLSRHGEQVRVQPQEIDQGALRSGQVLQPRRDGRLRLVVGQLTALYAQQPRQV